MRNDRPSANLSLTKSILQRWFGREADAIRHTAESSRHLPSLLGAHNQFVLSIQPVDALCIHMPAFPPQQHGQAPIAVAHIACPPVRASDAAELHRTLSGSCTRSVPDRQLHDPRRVSFTDSIGLLRPARQLPTRGLTGFYDTISCRICRSRLKSATNRFGRPISSRNCRSSHQLAPPHPGILPLPEVVGRLG